MALRSAPAALAFNERDHSIDAFFVSVIEVPLNRRRAEGRNVHAADEPVLP